MTERDDIMRDIRNWRGPILPSLGLQDEDELGDGSDFGVTGEWWGRASPDDLRDID